MNILTDTMEVHVFYSDGSCRHIVTNPIQLRRFTQYKHPVSLQRPYLIILSNSAREYHDYLYKMYEYTLSPKVFRRNVYYEDEL